MKIITWNVNGLRAVERKGELDKLLKKKKPDILLLQEIKGKTEQFSKWLTENEEYQQFYHSAEKPGYAGTGIWVEKKFFNSLKDVEFKTTVPKAPNMDEGRVSHLTFKIKRTTYDILSIYFPNGGKSEQAWTEKLVFFDKTLDYMNKLRKQGHNVIVGGDMNVAHTELDLKRAKENDGNIGFHPDERAWMDKVIENNWIDTWREKNPEVTEIYSWWNVYTRARDRNVGWRIDYFFIDAKEKKNIKKIEYLNDQMGSDHCPLKIVIES
jgi:exodeoxyribonuclease-3